jgi:hypothetical protein
MSESKGKGNLEGRLLNIVFSNIVGWVMGLATPAVIGTWLMSTGHSVAGMVAGNVQPFVLCVTLSLFAGGWLHVLWAWFRRRGRRLREKQERERADRETAATFDKLGIFEKRMLYNIYVLGDTLFTKDSWLAWADGLAEFIDFRLVERDMREYALIPEKRDFFDRYQELFDCVKSEMRVSGEITPDETRALIVTAHPEKSGHQGWLSDRERKMRGRQE